MLRLLTALSAAASLLVALAVAATSASAISAPRGQHCGDGGPIGKPDYCGCTWGEVYYRGQPVTGAGLTLTFAGQEVSDVVSLRNAGELPFYSVTGYNLGARRGDLITLTATFAGEVMSRTIRAVPDESGEQHVVFVFPERGAFAPALTGGYTRTLALAGGVLWAGGPEGLVAVATATGEATPQTLPWQTGGVQAVAAASAANAWAAGGGFLAHLAGGAWTPVAVPPVLGDIRALAVDPASGDLWAGGAVGETGTAARFDGAWHEVSTFSDYPVTAIAIDSGGAPWVGTVGGGAYQRRSDGGWTRFRDINGLASKDVLSLAAGGPYVWAGGAPYLGSGSVAHGGISRFDLTSRTWQTYGADQGLPVSGSSDLPAPITSLAVDATGTPWAGTPLGVYKLVTPGWWSRLALASGEATPGITALAAGDPVFIASTAGLSRLQPDLTPGSPPSAAIATTLPSPAAQGIGAEIILDGSAADTDENGQQILAWDWSSDRDGPLCTRASCVLKVDALSLGDHMISLRVQDDEGAWSPVQTAHLSVVLPTHLYLPTLLRAAP